MLRKIMHWFAVRSLEKKQRDAALELQAIYNAREAMLHREAYLLRYSAHLAVREIDTHVASRRAARSQANA